MGHQPQLRSYGVAGFRCVITYKFMMVQSVAEDEDPGAETVVTIMNVSLMTVSVISASRITD